MGLRRKTGKKNEIKYNWKGIKEREKNYKETENNQECNSKGRTKRRKTRKILRNPDQ